MTERRRPDFTNSDLDHISSQVSALSGWEGHRTRESFMAEELFACRIERDRLRALINTSSTADFLESVKLEAAHQRERWHASHDAGKRDSDWFWLLGYLAGKAIQPGQPMEKRLHHIITTAAACLNWHRHITGEATGMRPGIAASQEEGQC